MYRSRSCARIKDRGVAVEKYPGLSGTESDGDDRAPSVFDDEVIADTRTPVADSGKHPTLYQDVFDRVIQQFLSQNLDVADVLTELADLQGVCRGIYGDRAVAKARGGVGQVWLV